MPNDLVQTFEVYDWNEARQTVFQNPDPPTEATLESVVAVLGDETTASQEADSSVAAPLLDRIAAWTDALASGQADDEVRITAPSAIEVTTSAPLDVSAATVSVTDSGNFALSAMPGTAAEGSALPSELMVVAGDDGSDVHPLQLSGDDLKVSVEQWAAGTLLIEESSALDVSAAEVDVNLSSQALGQIATALELSDGSSYGEVQRTGTALNAHLASQGSNISVDLAADSLSSPLDVSVSNGPLDVSASEVDVDLSSQSLGQIATALELDDGTGTYGSVERTGAALNAHLAGQDSNISVELAADSLSGNLGVDLAAQSSGALDVSAATVSVEQQTPVKLENSSGTTIDPLSAGDQPLDVSASTVTVQESTALDVSAAQVDVDIAAQSAGDLSVALSSESLSGNLDVDLANQSSGALDVSAATVSVQEASALDVSAATVPVEQQTPVKIKDSSGTTIDPLSAGDQPLDVSASQVDVNLASQALSNVSVDLASDSLSGALDVALSGGPIDVSAATVDVNLTGQSSRLGSELEADDGTGTYGGIQRNGSALKTYLDGQASNLSVDVQSDPNLDETTDGVSVYGDNNGSAVPLEVDGNGRLKTDTSVSLDSVSIDKVKIEAGDGNGSLANIERSGSALKTYLDGQNGNISVDVQSDPNLDQSSDGVSIYGDDSGTPVAVAVDSNGVLQTDASMSVDAVKIEADDGSGTVSGVERNGTALETYLSGQSSNISVDLANQSSGDLGVSVNNGPLDVSAATVDVDLSSQSLARLASAIELTDGSSYSELQRTGTALNTYLDGQSSNISVDLAADSLSGSLDVAVQNGPLDVSASEVDVNLSSQGIARLGSELEADNGSGTYGAIERSGAALKTYLDGQNGSLSVDLAADSLSSPIDVSVSNGPLDVSASEVDVDLNSQSLGRLASAIEATNGTSYGEVQRTGNALNAHLAGQESNISVDVQSDPGLSASSDGVAIHGDNSGTKVPLQVDSNGVLQTAASVNVGSVEIEADDGSGNVSSVERNGAALKTYLDGQASSLSVDLQTDNAGLLSESRFNDVVNGSNELKTTASVSVGSVELEADDGSGTVSAIERNGASLQTSIQQWNAGALSIQEATALDVSASTVTVTDDGTFAINTLPSLPAGSNTIGAVGLEGTAKTSEPSAATAGDAVEPFFDEYGRLHVLDDNALMPANNGVEIYGSDDGGTTQRVLKTDADGVLQTNASVSVGNVQLEADDGSGTVSGVQRNGTALKTHLAGQTSNLSVDVQSDPNLSSGTDGVDVYGDNGGTPVQLAVDSSGVLQTNASVNVGSVQLEADDGSGTVSGVERNGASLQTAIEQWNAGTLSIQEASALDVSASTVTVTDGGNFAVSSLPSLPAGTSTIGSVGLEGTAKTSEPTATTAGDAVEAFFDEHGRLHVLDDNALVPAENGIEVYGNDNGSPVALQVDSSGVLQTNASVSVGSVEIEADDGSGTVSGVQRNGTALETYLAGQASNISVDLANQSSGDLGVSVNNGPLDVSASEIDVDLNSQTLGQVATSLELNDGSGTYSEVHQTGNAVHTHLASQASNVSVDVQSDPNLTASSDAVAVHGDNSGTKVPLSVDSNGVLQTNASVSVGTVGIEGTAATSVPAAANAGDAVEAFFDEHGRLHVLDDNAIYPADNGIEVYGSDDGGSTQRVVATDAEGQLQVDVLSTPSLAASSDAVGIYGSDGASQVQIATDSQGRIQTRQAASQSFTKPDVTNSAATVKSSAGSLVNYHITNPNTSFVYLKIYDSTSATVGTDSPALDLGVPPETGATMQLSSAEFTNGIQIAVTTAPGSTDSTAPTTPVTANLIYR
jgi:hypothetical protein